MHKYVHTIHLHGHVQFNIGQPLNRADKFLVFNLICTTNLLFRLNYKVLALDGWNFLESNRFYFISLEFSARSVAMVLTERRMIGGMWCGRRSHSYGMEVARMLLCSENIFCCSARIFQQKVLFRERDGYYLCAGEFHDWFGAGAKSNWECLLFSILRFSFLLYYLFERKFLRIIKGRQEIEFNNSTIEHINIWKVC